MKNWWLLGFHFPSLILQRLKPMESCSSKQNWQITLFLCCTPHDWVWSLDLLLSIAAFVRILTIYVIDDQIWSELLNEDLVLWNAGRGLRLGSDCCLLWHLRAIFVSPLSPLIPQPGSYTVHSPASQSSWLRSQRCWRAMRCKSLESLGLIHVQSSLLFWHVIGHKFLSVLKYPGGREGYLKSTLHKPSKPSLHFSLAHNSGLAAPLVTSPHYGFRYWNLSCILLCFCLVIPHQHCSLQ